MRLALAMLLGLFLTPAGAQQIDPIGEMIRDGDGDLLPIPSQGQREQPEDASGASGASDERASAANDVSPADRALGAFQRGFYLTARDLAEPVARLGDPAAQVLLAELHARGLGVPLDLEIAARWYKAAAKAGHPLGQFRYAMLLLEGRLVEKDIPQARDLMRAAAEEGLPLAEFNYAQLLIEASPAGGFEEALPFFRRAAEAGIPDAQYALAQLYMYGRAVPTDLERARAWLRTAAVNGHGPAQVEYGIWLINGKGGEARPQDGFLFLKFAAEQGNPIAINRLAHLYKNGIGTEPDRDAAARWVLIAKRANNSDPELDDFFRGLSDEAQKRALEAANRPWQG